MRLLALDSAHPWTPTPYQKLLMKMVSRVVNGLISVRELYAWSYLWFPTHIPYILLVQKFLLPQYRADFLGISNTYSVYVVINGI